MFGETVGDMGAMVGNYAIGFELKQGLSDIADDGVAAQSSAYRHAVEGDK